MEEERRLFYVALTRAKEELFLISEIGNESQFIKEIPGKFLDRSNFLILNLNRNITQKCFNCEKEVQDDFKYCPYCGKKQSKSSREKSKKSNPAFLIGERGKRKDIPKLIGYLQSEKYNDRRLAASACAKLAHLKPDIYDVVPYLVELLKSSKAQVRQYAISALGKIGDKRAVLVLKSISKNDKKDYNRESASLALNKIENYI